MLLTSSLLVSLVLAAPQKVERFRQLRTCSGIQRCPYFVPYEKGISEELVNSKEAQDIHAKILMHLCLTLLYFFQGFWVNHSLLREDGKLSIVHHEDCLYALLLTSSFGIPIAKPRPSTMNKIILFCCIKVAILKAFGRS